MKKTNLRINNFFIFRKDKIFYLTDIDVLEDWKESDNDTLEKYLNGDDITEKINELKNLYDINSNVNYILPDFKKYGDIKIISVGGSKSISA